MAITSKNDSKVRITLKSAQFRYSILYVLVTFIVLLFLNIYCTKACQSLFYNSKKSTMLELSNLASFNVSNLDVLNKSTIEGSISDLADPEKTRIIITDQKAKIIYDTWNDPSLEKKYLLYPEIVRALEGHNVFHWTFNDSTMISYAAVPIVSYGTQVGCVYMTEYDQEQGALMSSLQYNILTITIVLELAVMFFSLFFSNARTRRLRKIMSSIRTVRDGDYTHKLELTGHDELNILSNEFNDLITRLETSENKRNRFVSDASHELKTPLASIKLLSDSILQNDVDPQTVKEFVGDIGAEAERLNRMSQKLLTLSRIDDRQLTDAEITYITPTIERVIRMLTPNAEKNQISIQTDFQKDSSILILEDDLYQIVFNLVENGIKYNTKGGTLTICLDRNEDNAQIQITDTGVGIPEDAISHIFERFYRVDKARSRSTGGSGLGLSIVRNIVRRNNGEIKVISTVGVGTTVTVSFPTFDIEEDAK